MLALTRGVQNSQLRHLELSTNNLRDRGATILAQCLKHHECHLEKIDLTNNFIEI